MLWGAEFGELVQSAADECEHIIIFFAERFFDEVIDNALMHRPFSERAIDQFLAKRSLSVSDLIECRRE